MFFMPPAIVQVYHADNASAGGVSQSADVVRQCEIALVPRFPRVLTTGPPLSHFFSGSGVFDSKTCSGLCRDYEARCGGQRLAS